MMVDDAHPILMVLQSRPSVKHAVPNVQVHIEKLKRFEDANSKN